ncbi:hypothetical protein [Pantoea eucrina]|uniref:hypothetical protein n=1 Tax=Pantoea eucrina TaxID=472693 RepID=UPI00398B0A51|nr:ISNCY-family transposase from ISRor3 [Pantoea sp.]
MHAQLNDMLQAGETADADAFIRELVQRVPQHEDELMTIAQQLEQKGRQEDRQRGGRRGEKKVYGRAFSKPASRSPAIC